MARKERWVKKVGKLLNDAGVAFSECPTNIIFVSNSSVMCGVCHEDLEAAFRLYDADVNFIVYPRGKSYSFVIFSDVSRSKRAFAELNDTMPKNFPKEIALFYVTNVPELERPTSSKQLNGLEVHCDFVSVAEETALCQFFDACTTSRLKNRRVFHFGHEFDYANNCAIRSAAAIPSLLDEIIGRVRQSVPSCATLDVDQVTVNVYEAGQGIPPHVDTHSAFEETILSLSLLSDVVMEFRDCANSRDLTDVLLPSRSLMIMRGAARYRYKHGILNRKYDVRPTDNRLIQRRKRISITFRQIRRVPCECSYVEFCDWDRCGRMTVPQTNSGASALEQEYVAKVYEQIALHFDETRKSRWGAVVRFLDKLPRHSVVVDAGCGNGKYLIREDRLCKFGVDLCEGLVRIAHSRNCHVLRGDALTLPFRNASMDAALSIAVIHHFATSERRRQALEELLRVLRPGGRAVVTVWALEQVDHDRNESAYTRMRKMGNDALKFESPTHKRSGDDCEPELRSNDSKNSRLHVHDGRATFLQQDMLVPWNCKPTQFDENSEDMNENCTDRQQYLRYYHLFVEGELAGLVEEMPGCRLIHTEFEEGNWAVVFQRDE